MLSSHHPYSAARFLRQRRRRRGRAVDRPAAPGRDGRSFNYAPPNRLPLRMRPPSNDDCEKYLWVSYSCDVHARGKCTDFDVSLWACGNGAGAGCAARGPCRARTLNIYEAALGVATRAYCAPGDVSHYS
ncbi:hypothetical protein EVAR_59068_1 [Eumeta japonica]|uniref:Uncharacterized protein n=1 Tax=Eumeta variegata TaxID=151549 RepID=A0A4C1YB30_EUMVA|nr:hypothetical protein EVAR_59068_1 [Eumeta japonica]